MGRSYFKKKKEKRNPAKRTLKKAWGMTRKKKKKKKKQNKKKFLMHRERSKRVRFLKENVHESCINKLMENQLSPRTTEKKKAARKWLSTGRGSQESRKETIGRRGENLPHPAGGKNGLGMKERRSTKENRGT